MASPVAVAGDLTDIPGVTGELVGPPGKFFSLSPNVVAMGRPVLTLGDPVNTHGNPYNPNAPGYNPDCALAEVRALTIPRILVNGRPIAVVGSLASCGHFILGPGAVTVLAGT
jgi:uncharacterized Zn-binding protein involved in type VI secretion